MSERIESIKAYALAIAQGKADKSLYDTVQKELETITAMEVVAIQNELLQEGFEAETLVRVVDRFIHAITPTLEKQPMPSFEAESFMHSLQEENKALISLLEQGKTMWKANTPLPDISLLQAWLDQLKQYQIHLLKLENILFPAMEQHDERFVGLRIMWTLHDKVRALWKEFDAMLQGKVEEQAFVLLWGKLFFSHYGMVQKQTLILFPCVPQVLSLTQLDGLKMQSQEYGFCFITPPPFETTTPSLFRFEEALQRLQCDSGHLDLVQLSLLLEALPLDVTLVDEHDNVAYFSQTKERIFPRSAAIIGRNVRYCHPLKSVHVVEDILGSFKRKEQSTATFWIQMKGLFILIQYHALYDREGVYRGTLEITQELSHVRALEGEQRLLDWTNGKAPK